MGQGRAGDNAGGPGFRRARHAGRARAGGSHLARTGAPCDLCDLAAWPISHAGGCGETCCHARTRWRAFCIRNVPVSSIQLESGGRGWLGRSAAAAVTGCELGDTVIRAGGPAEVSWRGLPGLAAGSPAPPPACGLRARPAGLRLPLTVLPVWRTWRWGPSAFRRAVRANVFEDTGAARAQRA